jgi:hypothetical protein
MQSLAKMNDRIRIGKAEIEVSVGEKPKHVSLTELEEEKQKLGGKGGKVGNLGNGNKDQS